MDSNFRREIIIDNYENPGVYYYVDSYVGWFFLDSDNKATAVTDEDESIPTNTSVRIIDVRGDVVVVEIDD